MHKLDGPVKTKDLVHVLEVLGFSVNATKGTHTTFKHADGAIVTVPTGRKEVPSIYLKAIIGQTTARSLASGDEVRRLIDKLAARKAPSRKSVMSV